MTSDKKLTLKRIIIFLILAFLPVYIFGIFFTDDDANFTIVFPSVTVMLYPAIANFITRLITKEGLENSYLKINFKGNARYYVFSVIFPILWGFVAGIISTVAFIDNYSFLEAIESHGGGLTVIAMFLVCVCNSISLLIFGFGEEFGWRAYLTPKLEQLMPTPLAITVNGIIWGIWHAPLIVKGYDFGKDYPFFPYLGVIAMCISCVIMSFILTWLTKKTNSVYPAAICHIVIDSIMSVCSAIVTGDNPAIEEHYFMFAVIIMIIVPFGMAIYTGIKIQNCQKSVE